MSEGRVGYMNSGGALITTQADGTPFLRLTWDAVWTCPVCHEERRPPALRFILDPDTVPHAECRRQEKAWAAAAQAVYAGPEVAAALEAVSVAMAEVDRVARVQLVARGLPDWVVEREISDRAEGWS